MIKKTHPVTGQLHCVDGAAVIYDNGRREWLQHGKHHRVDGPAVVTQDGGQIWYKDGKVHRNGYHPAVTHPLGKGLFHYEHWIEGVQLSASYLKGPYTSDRRSFHREGGPAYISYSMQGHIATQAWYHNGQLHREDGPAYIDAANYEQWYQYGRLHRLDGPAVLYKDNRAPQWYVRGYRIDATNQEEANKIIKQHWEKLKHPRETPGPITYPEILSLIPEPPEPVKEKSVNILDQAIIKEVNLAKIDAEKQLKLNKIEAEKRVKLAEIEAEQSKTAGDTELEDLTNRYNRDLRKALSEEWNRTLRTLTTWAAGGATISFVTYCITNIF